MAKRDPKTDMIPRSLPMYHSTFERWVEYKNKKKWTHDEMLNNAIDMFEKIDKKKGVV